MSPIITHPAQEAHPDRDAAARKRADRLAKATTDQLQAAPAADDPEDDEPIPLCGSCGAPVGIFPELTLNWRHYHGDAIASGAHQTYDPGHPPEVAWYHPDEAPEEF
jgi:hypothetical protein